MINRRALECDACAARIITRTAIGLGRLQTLAFACPSCGVGIVFKMHLDQEEPSFDYEVKPDNAHWVESEQGARFEATFDVDFLVPRKDVVYESVPGQFRPSPYMKAHERFRSYARFATDESWRRQWLLHHRPVVDRLCVHFERQNWEVFTNDARKLDGNIKIASQLERFDALCSASHHALPLFTFPHSMLAPRIEQRVALASSISPELTERGLFRQLQHAGRLHEWWTQIRTIRSAYFEAYPYYHTILQPLYWKDAGDATAEYVVSNKGFSTLKDLYISSFEALARISVLAIGIEAVIHHGGLEIPTKKGSLSILEFEALSTANKRDHLARYPIGDIFYDFLDTTVRNGIGHNSARYDPVDDVVLLVKGEDDRLRRESVGYTEFCRKVVSLVSRLFVVEIYLNSAVRALGGYLEVGGPD